jgi:hypothetical protein
VSLLDNVAVGVFETTILEQLDFVVTVGKLDRGEVVIPELHLRIVGKSNESF